MTRVTPLSVPSLRIRSRSSRLRRGAKALVSLLVVSALSVGGVATVAITASAAGTGAVSLVATGLATQPIGSYFDYDVSWSCSGANGDSCVGMQLVIPFTLNNAPGGIEDMDSWGVTAQFPAVSAPGFTSAITRSGTQLILTLTATTTVDAGVSESVLVKLRPHPSTGDGIGFTAGPVQMIVAGSVSALSSTATGSLTALDLLPTDVRFLGSSTNVALTTNSASYGIYPNLAAAWNPITNAWTSWTRQDNNRNTSDTAVSGTISIVNALAPGTTFVSATGGGVYNSLTHSVTWTTINNPDDVPFIVQVEYPNITDPLDPDYDKDLTSTLTRTFTDTAGVVQTSVDTLVHSNLAVVRVDPILQKCSTGRVTLAGDTGPGGQCSIYRVSPAYNYSGSMALHYFSITAYNFLGGDVVTVEDWMPCLDNPVTSIGTVTSGFESRTGCINTSSYYTSLTLLEQPGGLTTRAIDYSELILYMSDGSTELYNISRRISSLATLPTFSGGRHAIGYRATLVPLAAPGNVLVNATTQLNPGANADMNIHNTATVSIVNGGYAFSGPTPTANGTNNGRAAVREVVAGHAYPGMSSPPSGIRYASGTFGTWGLNPADGTPTYTLVLPAGYELYQGSLSSITVGVGVLSDYNVVVVPEDVATGTPMMLRMTPVSGTAVPASVDESWPFVSFTARVSRTWGPEFGYLTTEAYSSISDGTARIDGCVQDYSILRSTDPRDLDGDGETTVDYGCYKTDAALFLPTAAAATSNLQKFVRDSADATWLGGNQTAVLDSGLAEYRLRWQNAGVPTLADVVMYDLFARVGDTGIIGTQSTQPRNSAFTPTFQGITGTIPARMTVYYTASSNPCRPEVFASQGACDNDWTTNLASMGTANVRGLKMVLPGNWTSGQSAELTYGMSAPIGTANGVTAWNTVASISSIVTLQGNQVMVATESARTGISLPADVQVEKSSPQSAAPVGIGDAITYEITATNLLDTTATGVRLVDDLTRMLNYASGPTGITATIGGVPVGTASYNSTTHLLTWDGNIGVGETLTLQFAMESTTITPNAGGLNSVIGSIGSIPTNCETGNEEGCSVAVVAVRPEVRIDKFSATTTEGSLIEPNTTVNWTYRVTNPGTEALEDIEVTDSRGVVVTCPATTLARGASMDCTGSGSVGTSTPYENIGVVSASGVASGDSTTANDPWSVRLVPRDPAVTIVKTATGVAEGSTVGAETVVSWLYTVTNTGTDTLRNITVVDDQNVVVTCPVSTLAVGASTVCTGSGSVGFGPSYRNVATVRAVGGFTATPVDDDDDWSVIVTPYSTGITIDKTATGVVEGSWVIPNTVVSWSYLVTNAGQEAINTIVVLDDRGVTVTCPASTLAVGASLTCTGSGSVGTGPRYENIGSVTGVTALTLTPVEAEDPWTIGVRNPVPVIAAVKGALNAVEGEPTPATFVVNWQYTVVNNGEEDLQNVVVTDDQGVTVSCPRTTLAVGASMVCTGSGSVGTGTDYTNVMTATAVGTISSVQVESEDPWSVPIEMPTASLRILKDASDVAVGQRVVRNQLVTWNYTVVNTGGQPYIDLTVTDDQGVAVTCPASTLAIGASMLCTGRGSVGSSASYTNIGTATGTPQWAGLPITVDDEWTTPLSGGPTGETEGLAFTGSNPLLPTVGALVLVILGSFMVSQRRRRRATWLALSARRN